MIKFTYEEIMYSSITKYKFSDLYHDTPLDGVRQGKIAAALPLPRFLASLLLAEGLAVGALVLSGVHLVGAHQNPVQGAVVLILAMISTLLNGTLDALVGMAIHKNASFEFGFAASMADTGQSMLEILSKVAFLQILW